MDIKTVLTAGSLIPTYNNVYNSDDWFIALSARMDSLLRRLHGKREIFDDYVEHTGYNEDPAGTRQNLLEIVDSLFELNCYKYRHLWTLYEATYNPLWNVDGTETIERERTNTGTQTNGKSGDDTLEFMGSEKDEHKGHDYTEKSGTESTERTGNETMEPSGTEKVTRDGSVVESHSGGPTNSRTTFDSAAFLDTDKTVDTGKVATTYGKDGSGSTDPYTETTSYQTRKDTRTYNQVKDTTSFNQRKDDTHFDSSNEKSFTGRKDKTTYNSSDTRTDNLSEVEKTVTKRGGNIGVTMTTQLERDELLFVSEFRAVENIIADVANCISYVW